MQGEGKAQELDEPNRTDRRARYRAKETGSLFRGSALALSCSRSVRIRREKSSARPGARVRICRIRGIWTRSMPIPRMAISEW